MPNSKDVDSKEEMIEDAMLIIHSVACLETQINNVLGEMQDAEINHLYEEDEKIQAKIRFLLRQIRQENLCIENFAERYKDKINEKEAILFGLKQKKQIHDGSFSAHQGGTPKCVGL